MSNHGFFSVSSCNGNSTNQQWSITNVSSSARIASPNTVEEEPGAEVSLSQNPFTSGMKISVPDPTFIKNIMMIDLTGKEVVVIEHENIKTEQIIGSHLNPGLDVVQINGFRSRQFFKVIKK